MAVDFKKMADALRFLSADAVERAQSGHPGMPMGMADIAAVLWHNHLRHDPKDPAWWGRDRFVLSNGHGAMLHYALLHLTGYDLSLDDLKAFRQLGSHTPGHPERGHTPGVEVTTGPLGQGLGNAVGMALAEKLLSEEYNRDNLNIFDNFTYVFAGDGCMMEGVSHEVCSLAGVWGLGRLIVFYDDNGISIDGQTDAWFGDETALRFRSYGWQVIEGVDGHDHARIDEAVHLARSNPDQPTLVVCRTRIGYGAPHLEGTAKVHGAPLGPEALSATRQALGWCNQAFEIPQDIRSSWCAEKRARPCRDAWNEAWQAYQAAYPDLAIALRERMGGVLPASWRAASDAWVQAQVSSESKQATRKHSHDFLKQISPKLKQLIGGSADLTPSNLTAWPDAPIVGQGVQGGRYIHYGVREFGMAAVMNGLAAYGGWIPYGGTFLTFVDYMRNAVRLSAMMSLRVVYVLTHDSIGLGEDGPTHQPIEHLSMLRMTPGVDVWRPADGLETAVAWQMAMERLDGPSVIALSRQTVPALTHGPEHVVGIHRGGYVVGEWPISDQDTNTDLGLDVVLMATGSELHLAMASAEVLASEGLGVRVVSLPCAERFLKQDLSYQQRVLPRHPKLLRVVIEAGCTAYWRGWVGDQGVVVGIDTYGASAPAPALYQHFGLTVECIVKTVHARMKALTSGVL